MKSLSTALVIVCMIMAADDMLSLPHAHRRNEINLHLAKSSPLMIVKNCQSVFRNQITKKIMNRSERCFSSMKLTFMKHPL